MENRSPLIVVRLTPPGRGAVATLLVEGPGAEEVVQRRFQAAGGRPLAAYPQERLVFGHFVLNAGEKSHPAGEEVVVRRRSPESVEIHCHGGLAAVRSVQEALVAEGARAVAWPDWVCADQADPIGAAARLALANARTERTARILLDQYQGALRRAIEAIGQALIRRDTSGAIEELETLLARAPLGLHLVEPWQVVLAGPPNVGKSSLINALVGYQRAIVHPTPGTTRDVVTAITTLDGWPVELSDTAGLRESAEVVERAGVALTRQRLADADLVILVFDRSQPWSEADAELVACRPDALVVHNKADLPSSASPPHPAGLATSAKTGQGIDALVRRIAQRLVPQAPPPGSAVPFTREQVDLLRAILESVRRDDLAKAENLLQDRSSLGTPSGWLRS